MLSSPTERRALPVVPHTTTQEHKQILDQAKEVLGYGKLNLDTEPTVFSELANYFHSINFAPLDPQAVYSYKKEMIKRGRKIRKILFLIGFIAFMSGIVGLLKSVNGFNPLGMGFILTCVIATSLYIWMVAHFKKIPVYWASTPIDYYRQPIPHSVLEFAIKVKRNVPDCYIRVSYPVNIGEIPSPDPFLMIRVSGYSDIYTHVWDEPTFEG